MSRYANETTVTVEKTRQEIEAVLVRYGADQFISGWDADHAVIGCRIAFRQIRITLPLPQADQFCRDALDRPRTPASQRAAHDQAMRSAWRCFLLVIKAKLEAIASGISTVEREFLDSVVLPDGSTVGERMRPQIEAAYASGRMPKLLPSWSDASLSREGGDRGSRGFRRPDLAAASLVCAVEPEEAIG